MIEGKVSSEINSDLQRERRTATFDPRDITYILDGGAANTRRRHEIENVLFSEPEVFSRSGKFHLDLSDRYDAAVRKGIRVVELGARNQWSNEDLWTATRAIGYDVGIGLHVIMFLPTIDRLASDEQKERWLPLALSLKMIGTYAQTELGHGTNLQKLETTATYDPTTEEFIMHTPRLSSMKWWPGGLGLSCNHALVLAQLVLGGKNHGMQAFLVPLRSMQDHTVLPGVEVGSIGPTLGAATTDNGYLILHNVRIPRENMLMKYAKVTPEGQFERMGSDRITYGTMVMVRATIVDWAYLFASHSATIATRYSAVRRQTEIKPGAGEVQVLDFQTQQLKLFPNIALGYAMYFAREYIKISYNHHYETEFKHNNFKALPEMHSQSCCLKAISTDLSSEAAEICRRACGGHGYLMAGGVAPIMNDSYSSVTFEGENTVLYQQTARYLLKNFAKAMSGGELTGSSRYLQMEPPALQISDEGHASADELIQAFQRRTYMQLQRVALKLQDEMSQGVSQYEAWNNNQIDLVNVAKSHGDGFVVQNFAESIKRLDTKQEVKKVLSQLFLLYALYRLLSKSGDFLETGTVTPDQVDQLRRQMLCLLKQIRPNAVALVDAFDIHDETLCSALGSYDGNAYQRLFNQAKNSQLCKTQIHPSYYKYIKPFQKTGLKAKL